MGLNHKLIEGLKLMGIKDPTPIQLKCIPDLRAGKDLVGQSLTGSGKTAAFGLPILEKIVPGNGLQALIITPTRELCVQVRDNLEQMARFLPINVKSVYGGVGFFQQIEDIKIAEIIVATPGRLLDHMGRRNVDLKTIKFVVLDEADRMFDMGFEEDIDKILRQTPHSRQTVMFSATMPKAAQSIAKKYLKNPVYVQDQLHVDKTLLKQVFYSVRRDEKFSLLVHLLKNKTSGPAIVFCGTKREVDRVARNLRKQKLEVMPVHGDLHQGRRQFAVNSFKQGKIDVLIATDVAARGLDIKDVSHVYNYDVPRTPDEYTHRIGRTARAGKKGDAVTLLSERDYENFSKIQRKFDIQQEKTPPFERIEIKKHDFGEERSSGENRYDRDNQNRNWHGREHRHGSSSQYGEPRNSGQNYSSNRGNSQGNYSQRSEYPPTRSPYSSNYRGDQNNSNYRGNQSNYRQNNYQSQNRYQNDAPQYQKNSFSAHPHEQKEHVAGGHERTPRTMKPLFPTSHYNPGYQKYKKRENTYSNDFEPKDSQFRPARIHKPSYPTDKNKSFHNNEKPHFYKNDKKKFKHKKRY